MVDSPKYKDLQRRLHVEIDEKKRIDVLLEMGSELRNFDLEEASRIAEESINRSKIAGYTNGIGKALKLKGSCHWLKGDYEMGMEVLKVALTIATKTKEKTLEARVYYYMGNISRDQGEYANVLTYYKNALGIYEELRDEVAQSVILASMSNLLYDLGDFESALDYALKCLPIFEQVNNLPNLINVCNTLGNICFKRENYQEALQYFKRNIENTGSETLAYVMAESGLGKVYYKLGDYENARKYLTSSLQQAEHLICVEVQIICRFYLGKLYMDKAQYRQAQQYLTNAYTLANEYFRKNDLMSIHGALSELYDHMGDVPKAFHHLKSYQQLKEELFQQEIINELRNMQVKQRIELANKEKDVAERTAHLKHQFMANMSHEIRTPMNAIVGMTSLLLNRDHLPAQERYLKAIELSANNLLVIINDILDLSKIEAGKIVIEKIDFRLNEVLQSIEDMLLLKAEQKNIGLNIHISSDIPQMLTGDPTRLNQILINLAGNAVKFTERGSVSITIFPRNNDKKLLLQFDVIDTGIGISQEHVEHIFDSFTQAGSDVTRKFGGTGLGLTISKQLANLMGGDITVTSQPGMGTTFSVLLPFTAATEKENSERENAVTPAILARLKHLTVLLAEDNEFNRIVATEILQDKLPGIAIDVAVNGKEAVDMTASKEYDLVLMDVQMPVMDGVDATRNIRKLHTKAAATKIIAMTANVMQEDVKQYYEAGMDEYISKPFQVDELVLKINNMLGEQYIPFQLRTNINDTQQRINPDDERKANINNTVNTQKPAENHRSLNHHRHAANHRQRNNGDTKTNASVTKNKEVENPSPLAPLSPLPETVTDRNFLKSFTGGNPEKIKKYVTIFMTNSVKLIAQMEQDLEDRNYPAVKMVAHTIKPQLSYMGIKEDISHVQQLEHMAGENPDYQELKGKINWLSRICVKAIDELKELA